MKRRRRAIAALLALVMLLAPASCGRETGGEDGTEDHGGAETVFQPLGDKVFVPEKAKPPAGAEGLASAALTPDGETLYLTTFAMEAVTVTHNGFDFTDMRRVYRLYKAGLSGGAAEELSAYQPPALPEGACGEVSITVQRANADGTVWVSESVWWYYYDVPPEFNPVKDDPWAYRSEPQSTLVYRLLDSEGSERKRIDVSDLLKELKELAEDIEDPMLTYDLSIDEAGNIYVVIGGLVYVVSPDREILFVLEDEGIQGGAVALADGTMGIRALVDGGLSGEFGCRLRTIDVESGDWGTDYDLTDQVYEVFAGSGRFLFLCDTGSSLYGWDLGSGEAVKLLNWAEAGLDQNRIKLMTMLPDGRMAMMIRDESDSAPPLLYLLTAVDRAEAGITERKVLIFGKLSRVNALAQQRIKAFNNSNSEYVIQIRDYYEMADGYIDVAIELLATDAQTGNMPDILDTLNLPLTRMGAKGLLEDLWPWIDQDPDFGREDLMTHVLEVASHDGKLYQAFNEFKISALDGPVSVLRDRVGWTLADMEALYESLPEDTALIKGCTTKEQMFRCFFPVMKYDFIDWEAGTCDFEGEAFRELLSFCDRFPAEGSAVSYDKALLSSGIFPSFTFLGQHLTERGQYFGEDITFIGYPTVDGSCGSAFRVDSGLAMSAACPYKEAAWSFIREWFLPIEIGLWPSHYEFCTNREQFERTVDHFTKPQYQMLPDGTVMTDESGEPIVKPPMIAQEELDRYMAVYEATERIREVDRTVQNMVYELAGAYFAGDKSLEETCRLIQGRMNLYVSENR